MSESQLQFLIYTTLIILVVRLAYQWLVKLPQERKSFTTYVNAVLMLLPLLTMIFWLPEFIQSLILDPAGVVTKPEYLPQILYLLAGTLILPGLMLSNQRKWVNSIDWKQNPYFARFLIGLFIGCLYFSSAPSITEDEIGLPFILGIIFSLFIFISPKAITGILIGYLIIAVTAAWGGLTASESMNSPKEFLVLLSSPLLTFEALKEQWLIPVAGAIIYPSITVFENQDFKLPMLKKKKQRKAEPLFEQAKKKLTMQQAVIDLGKQAQQLTTSNSTAHTQKLTPKQATQARPTSPQRPNYKQQPELKASRFRPKVEQSKAFF